jgi:hypothetical protein
MDHGSASDALQELIDGYRGTALAAALVSTGLADALATAAATIGELAERTGLPTDRLQRLLDGLVVARLVRKSDELFGLTPLARPLTSAALSPLRDLAVLAARQYMPAWSRLPDAVSGGTGFYHAFGTDVWSWRASHEGQSQLFDRWLARESAAISDALAAHVVLPPHGLCADIGGGEGALLASVLERNPGAAGILFEQASCIERLHNSPRMHRLGDRVRLVAGNFFASIDIEADVLVLKSILHDWNDDDCGTILQNVRACLLRRDGATAVIVERLHDRCTTAMLDLAMMCVTGGRERTLAELISLAKEAGLRATRIDASSVGFAMIHLQVDNAKPMPT